MKRHIRSCAAAHGPAMSLAVAGPLGLARAGLSALQLPGGVLDRRLDAARAAFRRPEARIADGLAAAASAAHGAIDVSDGLVLDAARFAQESGVGVVLEACRVVEAAGSHLAQAAAALAAEPLALALAGGEDYALLAAFCGELPPGFVAIGRFTPGSAVMLEGVDRSLTPLEATGFDHFDG